MTMRSDWRLRMKKNKQFIRVRSVNIPPFETPYRLETKRKILKVCQGKFLTRSEISEKLKINVNTLRGEYLYYMVRSGELQPAKPIGTKFGQAYKTKRGA